MMFYNNPFSLLGTSKDVNYHNVDLMWGLYWEMEYLNDRTLAAPNIDF